MDLHKAGYIFEQYSYEQTWIPIYVSTPLFLFQPDLAQSEDEDINTEICKLEGQLRKEVLIIHQMHTYQLVLDHYFFLHQPVSLFF